MAKHQIKQQIVQGTQGHLIEQTFNDNLLPEASEIEHLQRLDPNIMEWLKQTAQKEQEFRHESYKSRLEIIKTSSKGDRQVNRLGLLFSFLIVVLGMLFSAFLIDKQHEILGSIFAGGLILSIVSLFLSKVKQQNDTEKNNLHK